MSNNFGHGPIILNVAIVLGLCGLVSYVLLVQPLYYYVFTGLVGYILHKHYNAENISKKKAKVCIVGSGFSGLCMGIQLKKAGIDFIIYEKGPEIGGTWQANQYPGIKCDVWSILYQFSFYKNPHWSSHVSPGNEILNYMKGAVGHFGLQGHIRLNHGVKKAAWIEKRSLWSLELENGQIEEFSHLVSGCGALRRPNIPAFEGQSLFKGRIFHSAEWDQSYDLAGKKVAIIGSGASAVQIGPEIAGQVDQLFVFQRTPNWFFPRVDAEFPDWYKTLLQTLPILMTLNYWATFILVEVTSLFWLRKGPISRLIEKLLKNSILKQVNGNQSLALKMTPNYEIGCKRILLTNDFLPMFVQRPNVHLVTEEIQEMTQGGIITKNGHTINLDLVIFATGFHIEDSICGFETIGRGGHNLRHYFDTHPTAYNGISVPNFPNFFLLLGPNTVLAHNSVLFMIACQANYVMDCLMQMLQYGILSIEVKKSRAEEFRHEVNKWSLTRNISSTNCSGWYKNKNGVNFILWPSNLMHYWWLTRKAHLLEDFWITLEPKDNGN